MVKQGPNNKVRDLSKLFVTLGILLLVNYIGSQIFTRFDLTSEKRFTLSDATKDQLRNLEDIVFVRVYLEGDLPASYDRLSTATREMLDEFRVYGGTNIEYEFVNPTISDDPKENAKVYRELERQGVFHASIPNRQSDRYSEQIIFPGAIFFYRGKEVPMQILKEQVGASEEDRINISIQELEYQMTSTISRLVRLRKPAIGIVQGHGELDFLSIGDLATTLNEYYNVDTITLGGKYDILKEINGLIIAGPDSAVPEQDKFIIDQFIMKGGKVLWLVENMQVDADSLRARGTTFALPADPNLDDMLFKYGVRVNSEMILDLKATRIPVVTAMVAGQPRTEMLDWPYAPRLEADNDGHTIVKNMGGIRGEYMNTLDTIEARKGIRKTVLLSSSSQTKIVRPPHRVSLNMLREALDERQFQRGKKAVAVLLEGEFESVFKNRVPPELRNDSKIGFREKGIPNKMVVISDVDMARNEVNRRDNRIFPLGFDRFDNKQYGNRDFLMNCINYLFDDTGLIEVRAKDFKIRLLDEQKVKDGRWRWQLLNTFIPISLVLLIGMIFYYLRRAMYAN